MDRWSRRQFVQGVGLMGVTLAAGCGRVYWPTESPAATVHRIGYLSAGAPQPYHEPLFAGLQDLGYVEGQNLIVERRFTGGSLDGLREAAAELVHWPAEVIVVPAEPPARIVRDISPTTAVVMVRSLDPVGQGLVASLARPGGNVTGLTFMGISLSMCTEVWHGSGRRSR